MADKDLAQALDALFTGPPDRFLESRDALAKQLKAAGDKEASTRVKSLHKPTQAAQALNRLTREAKSELEALFEAGKELASGKDFKAALERQRAALDAVFKKASGPDVPAIMNVVRGAQVDNALADQLRQGHFSKLPEVQAGFFGLAPEGAPPAPSPPKKKPAPSPPTAKADGTRAKAEEARRAKQQLHEAQKEASALATQATRAEKEAEGVAGRADKARKEAEALAARAARVRKEADALAEEAATAEQNAAALASEATAAEKDARAVRDQAREAADRVAKLER
jgi:hypothetical protein